MGHPGVNLKYAVKLSVPENLTIEPTNYDSILRTTGVMKKRNGLGWVGSRRKGTQSHKTLYFSYLLGGHPWADSNKIWHACCCHNVPNGQLCRLALV